MKLIPWRNASNFEQEDFISNMPDHVITNIMDRLPLKDAVRTSILSINWRCKWTLLSKLVFDKNFFKCFKHCTKDKTDIGRIISKLLLLIKDAITKFVLYIDEACYSVIVEEDISYWILFLSRRGIKDLTLKKKHGKPLKLPTHLFSCLELKHLSLDYCCFDPPASFHGFPNLLSLDLRHVKLESGKFVKFFTKCPILKTLKISYPSKLLKSGIPGGTGQVKVAEMTKLSNLKSLSLVLCMLDNNMGGSIRIFELVSFLPKLRELFVSFLNYKDVAVTHGICSPKVDYNTMVWSQLRNVTFTYMKGSENEVCLMKCLLGCSPFLKKFTVHFEFTYLGLEKKKFLRELLNLQQAYPAVDINLWEY